MPHKGYFIVIEGIDGSGKSTLARHLSQKLEQNNQAALLTKEPGGSPLGKSLRTILQTQEEPLCPAAEFLLFAADRAQHFNILLFQHYNKALPSFQTAELIHPLPTKGTATILSGL